jgi:D-hydroxyproline dehydrogenase subunit beta
MRPVGHPPTAGGAVARRGMRGGGLPPTADVVVIGAGLVGAACALALVSAGCTVCVVDKVGPVGGTTAGGEGNILVSDKLPGPELSLALRSAVLWRQLADEAGGAFEFEPKGGVIVAAGEAQLAALRRLAASQRREGVSVEDLDGENLRSAEPHIAAGLPGGAFYPQDCQVQPVLAAGWHLAEAQRRGASFGWGAEVLGSEHAGGRVIAVQTSQGRIAVGAVINAAGPWSGLVADRLGASLPVRPRRGHILVTEPLPPMIQRKVYEANYVDTVISDTEGPQCSAVVESTKAGTILIGSSREFAGFDRQPSLDILAELAARATRIFPFLARVRGMRCYVGFRPGSPDHLPLIGPDSSVGGLLHASGHEGAGIGLAPATAELVRALLTGAAPAVDPAPFAPSRLAVPAAPAAAAGGQEAAP